MFEDHQLDRYRREARAALESFLGRLSLPTLETGEVRPLELKLSAELRVSGGVEPQTLEMTATPLKVRTETRVLMTGAALSARLPRRLEEFFDASDLPAVDAALKRF